MNLLQTLLLSIVEGITEFLPISSTGHLILTSHLAGVVQTEFVKSFEIIIQLGAILAVVVIYFKKLVPINSNLYEIQLRYKNLLIAFLPSAFFGLFFYKYIKLYLIGNTMVVIWSLLIGGIIMILFEKSHPRGGLLLPPREISNKKYFLIGMFQVLSMIPGVSRAFATIFGGMVVGMKREEAVEFSFLLAIPTMGAATGLDLIKTDTAVWSNGNMVTLLIGFLVSFITAYIVVKWLIKFVQSHNFNIFGWYRIILALLFFVFGL
ncbi:MAG: undecaprenyl-diphosphatase UppP [Candidatus Woesebacteria bacterium]|nr:undecaprenyl-diphosphatase UppP [Candidatus Woesebacteria bacterium]